ncbi:MAG: STAS domain-containing protein [Spirochaetes bacterium]|jgi:anti-sigma B factor antagonist|nr:STAS domain-containing protein [Spirochaetota bacterium]
MKLKITKVRGIVIVYLAGRLDVQLSADIEKEIHKTIESEPDCHFLLNLKEISYLSSSGIRIFVSTMRILKEKNKKLKLCEMDNNAKKIFEIVELMDLFDIYETEEEAIKSF